VREGFPSLFDLMVQVVYFGGKDGGRAQLVESIVCDAELFLILLSVSL
jgi:hypothetical protein